MACHTQSTDPVADACLAGMPAVAVVPVVQRTAHVPRVLPGVDVDDRAGTGSTAAMDTGPERLVPVPAEIEELRRDVPAASLTAATVEVAGDAVHPVAAAREVHTVLRRPVVGVRERTAVGRGRGGRRGRQHRHACGDNCEQYRRPVNPQGISPLSGVRAAA